MTDQRARILGSFHKRHEQIGPFRFSRIERLLQGEAEEFETRDRLVLQRQIEALGFAGRVSQANGTPLAKVLELANQGLNGSVEDQILVAGQLAEFSTELSSLIGTAPRPVADAGFEATLFIRSRGEIEVEGAPGTWETIVEWDEADTRRLPTEITLEILAFARKERFGWPSGEGMGPAKKARAPRAPRKTISKP